MNAEPSLLVLAPREVGGRIAAQAGEGRALAVADPYDALLEMGKRPWPAVMLAVPCEEIPAAARASRRLQKQARIVALCAAAQEQGIAPLTGAVLDDYLIEPPTRGELADLLDRSRAVGPAVLDALSGRELAELIESARTLTSLDAKVAELVSARLGEPVQWADADSLPPGAGEPAQARLGPHAATEPLLAFDDPPGVLLLKSEIRNPKSEIGIDGRESGGPVPSNVAGSMEPSAMALLAGLRQFLSPLRASARRTEVLRKLSITDELTGLYNRRYFFQLAGEILAWSRQKKARATLLLYDIDDFKRYNEEFGHPVGDEILREMAVLIRQTTRSQDVVARVGGEEFVVLFWEAEPPRSEGSKPLETPYELADRFRRAVASHRFPSLGPTAKGVLTISGGLATFPADGETTDELLRQADNALRAAKRSGKNVIRIIGPE